jgi:colanic acid/amylovoran biosynthesis glycosyltransferase
MPRVGIFRDWLLPISETFIKAQVDSLTSFDSVYIGCRRFDGLDISNRPVVALRAGLLGQTEQMLFRLSGYAPTLTSGLGPHGISLLHAHFGPDGAMAVPLAKSMNVPLMVTFHGWDATTSDQAFRRSLFGRWYLSRRARLMTSAKAFLAVSSFMAGKLLDLGFPEEKIRVHYIGVDIEKFNSEELPRSRTVLFVGRLIEKKGCEYLIRAMEPIQKAMPDVELVVVGDGALRPALEQLAKSTLRNVKFTGALNSHEIHEYMRKASVFCAPSIVAETGEAEGFGIVFIEAQSSGLPVVSFNSGGIPEAVSHGHSGFLAPDKDWRTLSEHISKLLVDRQLWSNFSHAGRKWVEKNFDLRKQTPKLERIYEETIAASAVA